MTHSNSDKIKTLPAAGRPWRRSVVGRWLQLTVGLALFGVAIALMVRSGLGLGPWDAFHVGLNHLTGVSVGMASVLVGLAIVAGTLSIGLRPGIGTLANMVFIGLFIDVMLPLVPEAPGWGWGLAYYLAALAICGYATGLYIDAGLGKGPRDGLMLALSQRSGWPVRRVRTLMEVGVLGAGWLMGGPIGAGTLLFTFAIGPVTQWGLHRFGMTATGTVRVVHPEPGRPGLREAA